ncbi:F-box protein-like protein [Tanacetum coccineum]
MLSSRAEMKKTGNTPRNCLLEAYLVDYDHQSTQSGALIGSNDDLLTEILLRVPAISILRFKSVSKHRRALLSHRQFTLWYDRVSICRGLYSRFSRLYIPFDAENESPPPLSKLDFYPDPNGIRIVQSCNGLLLCCSDEWIPRACRYFSEGVYWNGAIHWPPSCLDPLYFDLNVENFQKLPLPSASVASFEGFDHVEVPSTLGSLEAFDLAEPRYLGPDLASGEAGDKFDDVVDMFHM